MSVTKKPYSQYAEDLQRYQQKHSNLPSLVTPPNGIILEDFIKNAEQFAKNIRLNPQNFHVQELHRALFGTKEFDGGTLRVVKINTLNNYKRHPNVEELAEEVVSEVTLRMLSKSGFNAIVGHDLAKGSSFFVHLINCIKWCSTHVLDEWFKGKKTQPFTIDTYQSENENTNALDSLPQYRELEPSLEARIKPKTSSGSTNPIEYILWVKSIIQIIEQKNNQELNLSSFTKLCGKDFKSLTGYKCGKHILSLLQRIGNSQRLNLEGKSTTDIRKVKSIVSATYQDIINYIGLNKTKREEKNPSFSKKKIFSEIKLQIKSGKIHKITDLKRKDKEYILKLAQQTKDRSHNILRSLGLISCSSHSLGRPSEVYADDLKTLIDNQRATTAINSIMELKKYPNLFRHYKTLANKSYREGKSISEFQLRSLLGIKTPINTKNRYQLKFLRTLINKAKGNLNVAFAEANKYFSEITLEILMNV